MSARVGVEQKRRLLRDAAAAAQRATRESRALAQAMQMMGELEAGAPEDTERLNPLCNSGLLGLHTVGGRLRTDYVINAGDTLGALEGTRMPAAEFAEQPRARRSLLSQFSVADDEFIFSHVWPRGKADRTPRLTFSGSPPLRLGGPTRRWSSAATGSCWSR